MSEPTIEELLAEAAELAHTGDDVDLYPGDGKGSLDEDSGPPGGTPRAATARTAVAMQTPTQAVAAALSAARRGISIHSGWCDHYVATWYGLPYSGFRSAAAHFHATPVRYRHGHSTAPPPGALGFMSPNHVVLSVGNGLAASTDYPRTGHVGIAQIDTILANWGMHWDGWTDAWYASQGVAIIGAPPPPPPPAPTPAPRPKGAIGMAVMYLRGSGPHKGAAILIESGKQVLVGGPHANKYSIDGLPYAAVEDPAQDLIYDRAYGQINV